MESALHDISLLGIVMVEILSENKTPFGVELYEKTITNRIGVTEWTASHIGYLDENKTQLQLIGTINREDPVGMYVFNFRRGEAMHLATNNNPGTRVELYDRYARTLIADSAGDDFSTEKANFDKFLKGELELDNNEYLVKISHDESQVSKKKLLNYDIKISSGTTYDMRYRTKAAAQTMLQHLQEGGQLGYSAKAMTAGLFGSGANGDDINIFDFYV